MRFKKRFLPVFLVVFVLVTLHFFRPSFIPGPLKVFETLFSQVQKPSVHRNILKTGFRVYVSSFLALLIGVVIGTMDYFSESFSSAINMFFYPTQFVSEAVLTLIAIVVFGLNSVVVYIITVIAVVPDVFVATEVGLREVKKEYIEFGEVYTDSKFRILRFLILPQLLPYILAGLLRSHATAWDIVATTEVFLATGGLGYMIQNYYRLLRLPELFSTVLIIVFLGLVSDRILRIIKNKVDKTFMDGEYNGRKSL